MNYHSKDNQRISSQFVDLIKSFSILNVDSTNAYCRRVCAQTGSDLRPLRYRGPSVSRSPNSNLYLLGHEPT